MKTTSADNEALLASLQRSVSRALEQKRRLGQYAVIWRDGQATRIASPRNSESLQVEEKPTPYGPDSQ